MDSQQFSHSPWKVCGAAHILPVADAATLFSICTSTRPRPRKVFLSSRLFGSAASLNCQPAASSYKRNFRKTNKKHSLTFTEAKSMAAATCLTISLGFLATLRINLLRKVTTKWEIYTWGRLRCSKRFSPCCARKWLLSSSRSPALPVSPDH